MLKGARISLLTATLFCTVISDSQVRNYNPDCLNLVSQEEAFDLSQHHDQCSRDELGFSQAAAVRSVEGLFGLDPTEIRFVGCDIAPFYARIDRTEPKLHFEILYNSKADQSGVVIAIFHEIGHVYQLKQAGSHQRLLMSLHQDLQRAELGADYLAGIAIGRLHMDEKQFAVGLALVGSYAHQSTPHGLPHERSAAFNYGNTDAKTDQSLGALYSDFQDNSYGQIKHRW
jgi:hypothetical protein